MYLTHDAFEQAHFRMKGLDHIAATKRGTRPGDCIGDVCFNLIMQIIMRDVRTQLKQAGLKDVIETGINTIPQGDEPAA